MKDFLGVHLQSCPHRTQKSKKRQGLVALKVLGCPRQFHYLPCVILLCQARDTRKLTVQGFLPKKINRQIRQ